MKSPHGDSLNTSASRLSSTFNRIGTNICFKHLLSMLTKFMYCHLLHIRENCRYILTLFCSTSGTFKTSPVFPGIMMYPACSYMSSLSIVLCFAATFWRRMKRTDENNDAPAEINAAATIQEPPPPQTMTRLRATRIRSLFSQQVRDSGSSSRTP